MVYLAFSAVGVFVGALALLVFGDPSLPALAHLVFAVGVAPLIFGAISHFVPVLTRSGRAHRGLMWATLLLQLAGAAAFLSFNGALDIAARDAAALGAFLVATAFAVWLVRRARRTLGRPHPGWRWYLAAVVALSLALALVPAMTEWPEWRSEFRLLHLHLNTLGFIGLAALGTLQVLLPTAVGEHDAHAAARLHHDLPIAAGAVLAVAVGAAFWLPLALTGGVLLLFVVLNTGVAWWRRYGWRTLTGNSAVAALFAALSAYFLLLAFGILHAIRLVDGRDAVVAFIVAFLLPLVTGALSQLLPVWCHPGVRTPARVRMHAALRAGGIGRPLLFVSAGLLLVLGVPEGGWLAAAGMLSFVVALFRSRAVSRTDADPA